MKERKNESVYEGKQFIWPKQEDKLQTNKQQQKQQHPWGTTKAAWAAVATSATTTAKVGEKWKT